MNGRKWAVTHADKMRTIMNHLSAIMGTPPPRTSDLNWEKLHVLEVDLSMLDAPFTEEEILATIFQLPRTKRQALMASQPFSLKPAGKR